MTRHARPPATAKNRPAATRPRAAAVAVCILLALGCVWVARAEDNIGRARPPAVVDVNRPRTPYDCDLPIGINWYGSTQRCLAELCGGQNVYNEYLFDEDNRRRKNPCYGQSPTNYPPQ